MKATVMIQIEGIAPNVLGTIELTELPRPEDADPNVKVYIDTASLTNGLIAVASDIEERSRFVANAPAPVDTRPDPQAVAESYLDAKGWRA